MLQNFLDLNFIQIKEDENLAKLRKASGELAKILSKNKAKIISYTLIALDPDVKANNCDLNEAKKIIIKNWKTFVTNSGDTPITIIRAVILEALETMTKEISYACIIWFAGRNVIKHYKLGRESELLNKFLLDLGNKIEKEAIESWALPGESKLENLNIDTKELTGVEVNKAILQKYLEDASGPANRGGHSNYESPNPHWPNAGNNWAFEFAPRAALGIANALDKVLKEQVKAVKINDSQIEKAVNKVLIQTQVEIFQKNSQLQMRSQLLWWKEACYSESFKQSYRELKDGLLQLALANDYSSYMPFIYPTSADYFLKETHRVLISEDCKRMKISEILNLIKAAGEEIKAVFIDNKTEEERISLMNFVEGLVWNRYELKHFKNLVGISDTDEITLDEFTLWIFHDLQALKIINNK